MLEIASGCIPIHQATASPDKGPPTMHRCATALLLFVLPAQAHEHPREFAGNSGTWFDNLERPDNEQHPERFGGGGSHLCCTDKDAVQVQTKWAVPEGAKYPEPVWQVWIR